MAFITTKPILTVICSNGIKDINFDLFFDKKNIAQIITRAESNADILLAYWAKENNIDCITYPVNYKTFGHNAIFARDKLIVDSCDMVHFFLEESLHDLLSIENYCKKIGKTYMVHRIKEM